MKGIITYENLRNYTYSNDKILKAQPKGIVLDFFGLGGQNMYWEDSDISKRYAENGIIFIVPYNNPWAWMNKQAVSYTDEILDVIFEKYSLPENTPIVSSGGSMGGQSALVYTKYAKRTPVSCVANCPVCDMVYHYTERVDLPRTIYSALYNEETSFEDALKSRSPLHLIPKMPKVSYHIFHCDNDSAVNIDKHSRTFVEAMQKAGYDLTFDVVKGREHCDLDEIAEEKYHTYIINEILK